MENKLGIKIYGKENSIINGCHYKVNSINKDIGNNSSFK